MPHTFGHNAVADARWLSLLQSELISTSERRKLFEAGLTPEALLDIRSAHDTGIDMDALEALQRSLRRAHAEPFRCAVCPEAPIHLIHCGEAAYPMLLQQCGDAPAVLFVVGQLESLSIPGVSIVGTRAASIDGLRAAQEFASFMAQRGVSVVSGLALGVDAAAHRGALKGGGATVAVLPTGIDRIYPGQHRELARDISRCGALISEFLPGTPPNRYNFPRRNRTISGLTPGTLVIEAGRPSGTLITAAAAVQQGREVFAVPWSRYYPGGAGCLALLEEGATMAHSPEQVLRDLAMGVRGQLDLENGRSEAADTGTVEGKNQDPLLRLIGDGQHQPEALRRACGLGVSEFHNRLAELEIAGLVERDVLGIRRRLP